MRKSILLLAAFAALIAAPSAQAAVPNVFDGDLTCTAQPADGNVRLCSGPTTTFDGAPIDINVAPA